MTIASIYMPRWVSFDAVRFLFHVRVLSITDRCRQNHDGRKFSYGLHSRYSNIPTEPEYVAFPSKEQCRTDETFCNMWRTVGFFISFDVVIELCTLVSFIVIIAGGVQRRAAGWQIVSGLLFFSAFVQCIGMAIVVCLPYTSAFTCCSPAQHPLTDPPRPTSSTTTPASPSQATTSMPPGPSAPRRGSRSSSPAWAWSPQRSTSHPKATTSFSLKTTSKSYKTSSRPTQQLVCSLWTTIDDRRLYNRIGGWNDGYPNRQGWEQYQDTGSIRSEDVRSMRSQSVR